MKLPKKIYYGIFIRRDSRFSATVKIGHRLEYVFVPSTSRMRELLKLGRDVYLIKSEKSPRKTQLDLVLVQMPKGMISVDSRIPNKLFLEMFQKDSLPFCKDYEQIKEEARFQNSRFDFLLTRKKTLIEDELPSKYYVEVKSVTLVNGKCAYFPDAPTPRGTYHLNDLIKARKEGHGAAMIFVIQRKDARELRSNDTNDPAFGKALRRAMKAGVDIIAITCHVSQRQIKFHKIVPVKVD